MSHFVKDIWNPHLIRPVSEHIENRVLAAGAAAETVTIPADMAFVVIISDSDLWVRVDAVAASPTDTVASPAGSELNPSGYDIRGKSTISLASDFACKVSLAFYEDEV